jgi:2-polyprenyl-3-methyl-5-hydroxy-6-metoxy-1,4-benzoquinol methylase
MFDVLSFYRHVPLEAKIHVNMRWRLFPFAALEPYAPANGTIIDIGCGHGLWPLLLAHLRPQASILGIDPDENKIKIAREVASSAGIVNVNFEVGHLQDFALPCCDLVSIIDVMYVIPFDIQAQVVKRIYASLRSGGKLLLKEMSFAPAWKFRFNQLEEWLAGRVLGRSYGAKIYYRDEASWERILTDAGMSFQAVRLDSGYLHPHLLFIGDKI